MDVLDAASAGQAPPAEGGRGRRLRALLLALPVTAALLLWYVVCHDRGSQDPRAYPGSQTQDLPATLSRYRLRLPVCAERSVRYYRHAQWEADSLYLHFSGDRHCMNTFLVLNGLFTVDVGPAVPGLPFDARTTAGFGWPQDRGRRYRSFTRRLGSATGATLVDVQVALYEPGDDAEVYLHAGIV
jgi:hypothetical protein